MTQRVPGPSERSIRAALAVVALVLLGILIAILMTVRGDRLPAPRSGELRLVVEITGPGKGESPRFSRPLGAAIGSDGRVYVADTGNGRVCVFGSRGRFLREFDGAYARGGEPTGSPLQQPVDVAVDDEGTVYVADLRAGTVRVYDREGRALNDIRPRDPKTAARWEPLGLALAADRIYVADGAGVAVFDSSGSEVRRIDRTALGGPFRRVTAVAVDSDAVVVSDALAKRVDAFSLDGSHRWTVPSEGSATAELSQPRGVASAGDGSWYVVDAFRFAFARVTARGELAEWYGERGSAPTKFEYPNDVSASEGLVLVTDKENNRVQLLRLGP